MGLRSTVLGGAAAAAACLAALAGWPQIARSGEAACEHDGYRYAGIVSRARVGGVAATLSAVSTPRVQSGHAAAWVGVGGVGAGPRGETEWIQAGIAAFRGTGLRLYSEIVRPGERRRFTDLGAVRTGERVRVAVVELGRGRWQVLVEGERVGRPASLPGSSGRWRGVVTSESWVAPRRSCNRSAYRFEQVAIRTRSFGWTAPMARFRLEDAGHHLVEAPGGFSALGGLGEPQR